MLLTAVLAQGAERGVILVMGDSLSAGYGLSPQDSWVALLEQRLAGLGYEYEVVNASMSGETTLGGRSRLPRALERHHPDLVIIELGGNDGLRGLPLVEMRSNLTTMIQYAREAGADVVLAGMRMPPNYGPRYAEEFRATFGELAREHHVPLVPFFLEDVALDGELMQADGIHPNARAQPTLLDNVWPAIEQLVVPGTP